MNLNTNFNMWKLATKSREHHALLVKFKGGGLNIRGGGELLEGLQQQIQKIQKGLARTLNSSILDTFYFSET